MAKFRAQVKSKGNGVWSVEGEDWVYGFVVGSTYAPRKTQRTVRGHGGHTRSVILLGLNEEQGLVDVQYTRAAKAGSRPIRAWMRVIKFCHAYDVPRHPVDLKDPPRSLLAANEEPNLPGEELRLLRQLDRSVDKLFKRIEAIDVSLQELSSEWQSTKP